jgi:hypothetical protein
VVGLRMTSWVGLWKNKMVKRMRGMLLPVPESTY